MDESAESHTATKQYVTFANGDRYYGIQITRVREIRQWSPTTELPNQPHYSRGVLNIRGVIVPVHDLRARFGGGLADANQHHVVLILALGDQHTGLLVDAVSDIVTVTDDQVRGVPLGARTQDDGAIVGLVSHDGKMIALIEPDRLFAKEPELV